MHRERKQTVREAGAQLKDEPLYRVRGDDGSKDVPTLTRRHGHSGQLTTIGTNQVNSSEHINQEQNRVRGHANSNFSSRIDQHNADQSPQPYVKVQEPTVAQRHDDFLEKMFNQEKHKPGVGQLRIGNQNSSNEYYYGSFYNKGADAAIKDAKKNYNE